MKNSIRYEWRRLTSTPGLYLLSIVAVLGAVATSWLLSVMMAELMPEMTERVATEAATVAATRTPFLPLAAGLLGSFSLGQEKRYETLTYAFLVTPNRNTLLGAKALITLLITTVWALVSIPSAVVISNAVLKSGHVFHGEPRVLFGFLGLAYLWALAGLAAGVLLSRTGAVLLLIVGSTVVEPLLSQLLSRLGGWGTWTAAYLPFTAGSALIGFDSSDFSEAIAETTQSLPASAGAAVALTYLGIALGLAYRHIRKIVI